MGVVRPIVVGIETSCDDTACAFVDGEGRVLASVVSSQLAAHRPYGGVVPEIASREHLHNWLPVAAAAAEGAGVRIADVDAVAATRGPGLVGSLLVGLSLGRAMAWALERPFLAVHHLEGHLVSPWLDPAGGPAASLPGSFLGAVISGGHTSLVRVTASRVELLAETRDDAMGEVFDKVGKRLGLAYPQGPAVDRLAEHGSPGERRFAVPRMSDGSLDFSYSGLKSETLRALDALEAAGTPTDLAAAEATGPGFEVHVPQSVLDVLAAFRCAAVDQILDRLDRVLAAGPPVPVLGVSGGAAANRLLRQQLASWGATRGVALRLVPLPLASDNAAMIAHAALLRLLRGESDDPLAVTAVSREPLGVKA